MSIPIKARLASAHMTKMLALSFMQVISIPTFVRRRKAISNNLSIRPITTEKKEKKRALGDLLKEELVSCEQRALLNKV